MNVKKDDNYNILSSLFEQYHSNGIYEVGYKSFGPLLYGFVQWVENEAIQFNADQILFLARDGYVIQKTYKECKGSIKSDYLYVSRRSLTVPMLTKATSMNDVLEIVPYIKREETARDFLHKLGVENRDVEKRVIDHVGKTIERADLNTQFGDEIYKEIEPVMKSNALFELNNAALYLRSYFENKKVVLVDLGWYGTIQKSIEQLMRVIGCNTEILGLYIGRLFRWDNVDKNNMKGFVFDLKNDYIVQNIVFGYNGLIESFFTANHGSTKNYSVEGNPILEQYESENWDLISELQDGALKFVKDMNGQYNRTSFSPELSFYYANRLFTKPTLLETDLFGQIVFYDVYYEKLINFKGYGYYIKNPKRLYKDFMVSNWKIGFIKKATRILPSKSIYKLLIRIRVKK